VVALDAIVDGSGYPSTAIERNAHRLRQSGIGYSNLVALLLSLGTPYDSDEGRAWAAAITALMTGVAYRRSAELAVVLGAFEQFAANREPMLGVIERHRRRSSDWTVPSPQPCWALHVANGRSRRSANVQREIEASVPVAVWNTATSWSAGPGASARWPWSSAY